MTEIPRGSIITVNGIEVTDSVMAANVKEGWADVRVYSLRGVRPLVTADKSGARMPATARVWGQVQVVGPDGVPVVVKGKSKPTTAGAVTAAVPEGHKSGMPLPMGMAVPQPQTITTPPPDEEPTEGAETGASDA